MFYYGDHGGVLARSKRYVYESGTRVPFIVRIPEKYKDLFPAEKPGSKVDRLISFVDLVPTLLSITGVDIPDYLQGDAFLGEQKTKDPEYAFMFRGRMDERYDMSRAVRDKKYRYIRNYMPHRIYGQHLEYLWRAPSIRSWEQAYKNGECNKDQKKFWEPKPKEELYDTENDPWEVNNLANDPEYRGVLIRMRAANKNWITGIYDTGFITETDMVEIARNIPMYDYMRSGKINLELIIEAAEVATQGNPENISALQNYLKDKDRSIRYWGALGLLLLENDAETALNELKTALNDESANVVSVAAEALYRMGEKEVAREALLSVISRSNEFGRCYALNTIDVIQDSNTLLIDGVINVIKSVPDQSRNRYDMRAARVLLDKWGVDLAEYDINLDW
ncbi:sulfatase/phosphatase domain-containing protein [uncultured Draconibacterium sp.]|uniref:sulfatase/phosphatase domain-containing protein n=1 Tax=uncultured Draconibacterium sp. TaxID=1573823 RepID=UPI002AA6D5C3|nr:sulfatase/phosphatase domain-containing protein [uncultured Draconibacterium sp.]